MSEKNTVVVPDDEWDRDFAPASVVFRGRTTYVPATSRTNPDWATRIEYDEDGNVVSREGPHRAWWEEG